MATPEAHDLGVKLQRALGVLDSVHGLLKDEVLGSGIWLMHTLHHNKSRLHNNFVVTERQAHAPLQAAHTLLKVPAALQTMAAQQKCCWASVLNALQPLF